MQIADVLERHGYDSRKGRIMCPNPDHSDTRPGSVSIFTGRDGKERLMCHACGFRQDAFGLARHFGEYVHFAGERPYRKPRTVQQLSLETALRRELADDPTVEKDWIAAKKLAVLGSDVALKKTVLDNFDFLSKNFNLPRIYELVKGIWTQGAERYGLPNSDTRESWQAWVDKVAKHYEEKGSFA